MPIDLGAEILSDLEKDSFFGMAGTEVRLKAMWEVRTSVDKMFKEFGDENRGLDSTCRRIKGQV